MIFKIFFRNFWRNKVFSFINIAGLAVGLATCMLIMLYITDEYSYDKHHKAGDRIFRVASDVGRESGSWAAAPAPLAPALKAEMPEVEQAARLLTFPDIKKMLITYQPGPNAKQFFENNGYYADASFFDIFSYRFIAGHPNSALSNANTMVVSAQMAQKYFGSDDPMNKVLIVHTPMGDFNYTVTGVFDNSLAKSHIPSNFFLSMKNNDMGNWVNTLSNWAMTNIFFTYIKVKPGTDIPQFETKLKSFFHQKSADDIQAAGFSKTLFLQPVKDIYLHSAIGNEIATNGNIRYLYIFGSIAGFILLVACINFMNLSTARSEQRAKEVGVRKSLGAERYSLAVQFLTESFLMCLMALALALVLTALLLPFFNQLTQKNLTSFDSGRAIGFIVILAIVTGLLAGLYPSFYLSSFNPVTVLKGKALRNLSAVLIRKGLVVFQFSISICLMLGVIIIWKQMNFLNNQQLGFNKEQQIVIPIQFNNGEKDYTAFKNKLLQNSSIKSVTAGSTYPGIPNINDMLFYAEGKTVNESVDIHLAAIENEYVETLGMKLLQGRSFSKQFTADSNAIVLNESAIKKLGYEPAAAVGRNIHFVFENVNYSMNIVGVVKDFNFESLHKKIEPFGFATRFFANKYSYVIASFSTTNYSSLITDVRTAWQSTVPGSPFEYSFIDQDFQRNYEKEQRTSKIVVYFTSIAIIIACLGLFGLAAFSAEQRTKEIGIRKTLGASVANITTLLSKDFMKLVLIAFVIASPLAWLVMNKWLQHFAYRTNISWWIIALAGLAAFLIALITISFQSVKAALMNPVKALRSE